MPTGTRATSAKSWTVMTEAVLRKTLPWTLVAFVVTGISTVGMIVLVGLGDVSMIALFKNRQAYLSTSLVLMAVAFPLVSLDATRGPALLWWPA